MSDHGASAMAPWAADRPLDEPAVTTLVRAQFPDLENSVVESLGSGWDFDAYRVGDWVFRFPRRAAVDADLERRRAIPGLVRHRLASVGVVVPIYEREGRPSDLFPYRFTGHRWVAGVAVDRLAIAASPIDSRRVAEELGRALSVLHATPTDGAGFTLPTETDTCDEWWDEVIGLRPRLDEILEEMETATSRQRTPGTGSGAGPTGRSITDWLESDPRRPRPFSGTPCFLHDDICPDHVLADLKEGAIVGLIDFDDASAGDPVHDFVLMRAAMGADFIDGMVDGYDLPMDDEFRFRIDFAARLKSLDWLYDAHSRGVGIEKQRRWVANAFSE